ncbi:MAG: hypothetical protein M3340_02330 [Actinomycetota bacterium]|nr:hypothetical protein [Actinomycetota bacterium]
MGTPQQIQPGNYTASADGFVMGVVGWPSSSNPGCVGYAFGMTAGMTLLATGGNLGAFGPAWSDYQASNGNSFTMPVASGSTFTIAAQQTSGGLHQADAPIWFYWITLGDAEGDAFERTGDVPEDVELPALPEASGAEQ